MTTKPKSSLGDCSGREFESHSQLTFYISSTSTFNVSNLYFCVNHGCVAEFADIYGIHFELMLMIQIHNTQSTQISQKQDGRNVYAIMKTMCPLVYHNMYSTILHHVPKCMSSHKGIVVIIGRAHFYIVFMIVYIYIDKKGILRFFSSNLLCIFWMLPNP